MSQYKIIAYITEGNYPTAPQVSAATHINYAFGWVTEDSVIVSAPEKLSSLRRITSEKGVKLLLSLQQRGGNWFCKRSKTAQGREKLAKQAAELAKAFDLDGIDVDWEYPGIDLATGKDNCDTCADDFISLLAAMRAEMPEALLTIACGATPETWRHMDFARADKYLDHINIMGYDYNWPVLGSAHQSNIYPGRAGAGDHAQCGDRCVQYMLGLGLRADKLNMGVPFYAYVAGKGPDAFLRYDQVEALISSGECKYCFDEQAQQSYLTRNGEFCCTYDCPKTIAAKWAYIKEKGLGGMMYWAYNHDDPEGTLRTAVFHGIK